MPVTTNLSNVTRPLSHSLLKYLFYIPCHFYRKLFLEILPEIVSPVRVILHQFGDLVLVGDVAGDVGGDREELDQTEINLKEED